MKKILIIYALAATAAAWGASVWGRACSDEARRHLQNEKVLTDSVIHYRTRCGEEAASAGVLRLRCDEYERLRADDARRIRELGIRLRRVESAASVSAVTECAAGTVVRDTVRADSADSVHVFGWTDGWVTVEGEIAGDSVLCRVESIDTLRQIVHRVPRKFLFIRFGTKAVRQEIISSNPHTRIISAEYVELAPRRNFGRGGR